MKKLLFTLFLAMVVLSGCEKKIQPTRLDLIITQQPTGGYNVSTVHMTVTGTITGDPKPITVVVEWWWKSGYGTNQQLRSTSSKVFEPGKTTAFTSGLNAQPGYYHLNYIWAKIKWTDDTGSHMIESNEVFCN